jgi:hypothetical protein
MLFGEGRPRSLRMSASPHVRRIEIDPTHTHNGGILLLFFNLPIFLMP